MQVHTLKIAPMFYKRAIDGSKPFEIRKDDRDYQTGDLIEMYEYSSAMSWSAERRAKTKSNMVYGQITYITKFNQQEGLVVFGYKKLSRKKFEELKNKKLSSI
jgi:hypothetical protein